MNRTLLILITITLFVSCTSKTAKEYYDEGVQLYEEGAATEAQKSLAKSVELDKTNTAALMLMAEISLEYADPDAAIESLKKYEANGGDEITFCKTITEVYRTHLNDKKEAISYYKRLVKLEPENCEWLNQLGNMFYYMGEREDARKYFDLANAKDCIGTENLALLTALKYTFTTFEKKEYNFSLNHPTNWENGEKETPEMYFFETFSTTGISFNLTIASDQGGSEAEWRDLIQKELLYQPGVEVLDEMDKYAGKLKFIYSSAKKSSKGQNVIINNYVHLQNGKAYMLNFSVPESLYAKHKEVENIIFQSLVIN